MKNRLYDQGPQVLVVILMGCARLCVKDTFSPNTVRSGVTSWPASCLEDSEIAQGQLISGVSICQGGRCHSLKIQDENPLRSSPNPWGMLGSRLPLRPEGGAASGYHG